MATLVFADAFFDDAMEGVHTLASNTIKIALSNTTVDSADSVLTDITQITAANGYVAGGNEVTSKSSTQTSGTYTFDGDNVVFTASGGSIATFRYAVLYNDTAGSDQIIGYYDNGSGIDVTDGNTCTITFGASIFTFTTDA